MRILHLVHQYPPEHVGGVELYTQRLTALLSQRDHAVAIFTRQDRPGQGWAAERQGNVTVYRAWDGVMSPARRYLVTFNNSALLTAFAAVLEQFQPDLIHVQHLLGLPLALMKLARQRGIPYLVSLHDYWWVCVNANLLTNYSGENCAGPAAYLNCTRCVVARAGQTAAWLAAPAVLGSLAWRGQHVRAILDAAQVILAPSEFVQRWYGKHGVAGNLQVLPLGVEEPPATLPQRSWQPGTPLRLLYLGSIAHLKGVHILINALRQVQGKVELWIAGDLATAAIYAQQMQAQTPPQVTFLGSLTRPQVWDTLARVDAVLVPSLSYETYCFVAREAFAASVPVLAADIGALSEVVEHQVNGFLLPPGDVAAWQAAIQHCVDQPELLQGFRQHIPQQFTVAQHVDQVETIYRQILPIRKV